MAWVLGEYGYTMGGEQLPGIADKLCGLAERQHSDPDTKTYIVSALIKLVAQMVSPSSTIATKPTCARSHPPRCVCPTETLPVNPTRKPYP